MSQTADAYFIGRILGASGFKEGAFCRWWISAGQQWKLVNGLDRGQTQTDCSNDFSDVNVWSHPIDAQFEFAGIQGWPKLSFQVWQHDSLGRSYLGGYGFCDLPMSPGNHDIDVHLWRPTGSYIEELTTRYIGGSPHLQDTTIVHAPKERYRIKSESVGTVHLNVSLILGRTSNFQIAF
ncbi:B9 domain-containing protein 2 [Histomonas meleagridis]|uniref:B9 domain-containing protein 2 n=1 Tax=Histomonas meleagridis TaxID=135588 RepID=UPI00355A34F4|nr:B9 domain-containing protein 2 [Histomonas meleagridis]KAH0800503.1 B9 domain-containing protein 2 [Histomonas meleagridis]